MTACGTVDKPRLLPATLPEGAGNLAPQRSEQPRRQHWISQQDREHIHPDRAHHAQGAYREPREAEEENGRGDHCHDQTAPPVGEVNERLWTGFSRLVHRGDHIALNSSKILSGCRLCPRAPENFNGTVQVHIGRLMSVVVPASARLCPLCSMIASGLSEGGVVCGLALGIAAVTVTLVHTSMRRTANDSKLRLHSQWQREAISTSPEHRKGLRHFLELLRFAGAVNVRMALFGALQVGGLDGLRV